VPTQARLEAGNFIWCIGRTDPSLATRAVVCGEYGSLIPPTSASRLTARFPRWRPTGTTRAFAVANRVRVAHSSWGAPQPFRYAGERALI